MWEAGDTCYLLFCDHDSKRNPVVVDLKSIKLNLVAYSFRRDVQCESMTDWNPEGSVDGSAWQMLHAAREEDVSAPTSAEIRELTTLIASGNDELPMPEEEVLAFL